ncbi:MAG: sodium/solute symporter, partial [Candidatus Omnitrophota bacterium]
AIIVGLALYLTRKQKNIQDYYLAGKKIKWWQSGASTMATQLGAISFVSAPAFVAIKQGGGLKWLAYEFGVPLALILVMAVIIPVLHRRNYISIYEYLEERFDAGTRSLVSFFFQLGRGLATAVSVLAGGLILSTALNITTIQAILLIGIITVIYDVLGGIRVVILSDFLQMVIIVVGLLVCSGVALHLVGWEGAWASLSTDRLQILDFKNWGMTPEGTYAFWPMAIGGFFLYASYYGADQSQVQRELSVGGVDDVRKSLMVNALGRFPLVLLYCVMGVLVGAVFAAPESLSHIASVLHLDTTSVIQTLRDDPDRMVPMFILSYLPHGVIGFLFVAIMAALMSSVDSGLNSLSAVTMKDFYQRYIKKEADERHYLWVSKFITFLWGMFCVIAAMLLSTFGEATRQTTIVLINAVGSLLYGPILAAFLLGMFSKRLAAAAVKIGIISGVLLNLFIWQFSPISWMWWNLTGFLASVLVALVYSLFSVQVTESIKFDYTAVINEESSNINWPLIYKFVVLYFFLILALVYLIERLGSH